MSALNTISQLIIMALLSLTVTTVVYPFVLRYALRHHIEDNPDARKVHRIPVPVMGGVAVLTSILAGCIAMTLLVSGASIHWSLMTITSMLVLGVWDDIKDISSHSATFRAVWHRGRLYCLHGLLYRQFSWLPRNP